MQMWRCRQWGREGWSNKIINKQELWGFSCHSNCCHLTSGGLWRAGMIDLPFSVLQLFTHQQQKFQLKCWSGGIFIATDTPEAHVSLQAWMSWWRRLGEERGGIGRLMRVQSCWQRMFSVPSLCSAATGLHSGTLWYNTFRLIWRLAENRTKHEVKRGMKAVCFCVCVCLSVLGFFFTADKWLREDGGWRTLWLIFDSCAVSAGSDVTGQCWEWGGGTRRALTPQLCWISTECRRNWIQCEHYEWQMPQ